MSMSVLQSGMNGVQNGLNSMRRDAAEIASASTGSTADLTRSLVNLQVDQRQVDASVKVIKAADEMIGTLLDELA